MMNTKLNLYGRDWSRQTGASDISCVVSSAAMSSTGWQTFNTQSVCSSWGSGSDLSKISCGELCNQQYYKDLQNFSNCLCEPLLQGQTCMREVDESLVDGLEQILEEAVRMVNEAGEVTARIYKAAHQFWDWIPHLCSLRGEEESHQLVVEVHELLKVLRQDSQAIRVVYINLLDKVGYIGQCTEVRIDESCMSSLKAPEQDADGNYIDHLPELAPPSQTQQLLENSLRMALVHLDRACSVLEDCPEFWLMLHKSEIALMKLEKKASKIVELRFVTYGSRAELIQLLASSLRSFCQGQLGNSNLKGARRPPRMKGTNSSCAGSSSCASLQSGLSAEM